MPFLVSDGKDDAQAEAHRQAHEQAQQHYQQFHGDYEEHLKAESKRLQETLREEKQPSWKNKIKMNLSKIESVNIHQSFIARILGYGTIIITGTGGTNEVFHNIANPREFKRKFMEYAG